MHNTRPISRLLCSKTPLGQSIVEQLNRVLLTIADDPQLSATFRALNFQALGYDNRLLPLYRSSWQSLFALNQ